MLEKMKALVTGATGFVGSHLADRLKEKGYDVKCTIRKTSNLRWLENKGFELVESSLNDKESLKKAVKDVDVIFHVAGLTFAKNEEEFLKGNRDGTKNLLEAAEQYNPNLKRFVFVSSQTVAGPAISLENPVHEEMEPNPITAYARSKKVAEDVVLSYKGKIPFTICRAPAVYGPRDTAIFAVFQTVNFGLGTLMGLNKKYISLIHALDLADGLIKAAESENAVDQTYFITSNRFYSWDQLINQIKISFKKKRILKIRLPHFVVLTVAGISEFFGKFSKKPPVFNYDKGIDFIQDYWICSHKKAKNEIGFEQNITVEEGIDETVNWYKDNKWL
jgi:nucleoside-diphosphate-sugar epimerase